MEYTTTKKIGNSTVLSATFSADEVSAMRREATLAMAGKLRIPGFRPGKAPLSIVGKYVSDEELKDDVLQKAASQAYVAFLKEHKETDALIFEPEIVDSILEDTAANGLKVDVRVFEIMICGVASRLKTFRLIRPKPSKAASRLLSML